MNMEAFCTCKTLISQLQEGSMTPCEGSRRQKLRFDVGQTGCNKEEEDKYVANLTLFSYQEEELPQP